MKWLAVACCCCTLQAADLVAQAPAARVIVGNQITGSSQTDTKGQTVTETATLRFGDSASPATFTVDFAVRRPLRGPASPATVVDVIVTEQRADDDAPDMALRVNDEPLPVVTRLRSRRSLVATIPAAEFDRIARAGAVSDRTFDVTLQFGRTQIALLRATADRWFGR